MLHRLQNTSADPPLYNICQSLQQQPVQCKAQALQLQLQLIKTLAYARTSMQCACITAALLLSMQEVIEEVQQQATAEGAFGRGTSRYLDPARPDVQLPTGAAWSTVKVR